MIILEIRHLQTFISIVELGGFTKAAEYLGYAQSTITSHIQILESEIGVVLFERLGKKIILTNAGKELLPYARQMIALYKDIKNISKDSEAVAGDLVIGAGESLSIYRLGEILKEYKKRFPKVNIILKNSICSDLRKKIHSGELDIIFTIEPPVKDDDLVVMNLKDESMVFIGSPGLNLEKLLSETKKDDRFKEPIIFSEKGCRFRISFEDYLKKKKIRYTNPLEFSSIEAIKKFVMNGLGISFLPFYAVSREVQEGNIKAIEAKGNFATQLIYHKDKQMSKPLANLIEIVMKHSKTW